MKRWFFGGFAAAATAGGLALIYANQVERQRVQLARFDIGIEKTGLPAGGLTILHLSDFHFRAAGKVQQRKVAHLRSLLMAERYDVVALTGDLIHDIDGLPAALSLIEGLQPRYGAYFVPGNHDYAEYTPWGVFGHTWRESADAGLSVRDAPYVIRSLVAFVRKVVRNELVRMPVRFNDVPAMLRQLEAAEVQPLVNRAKCLQFDGAAIWFAGLDDLTEGRPDLSSALDRVPLGAPLVLLAHNPDIWLQCGVDRADLVLSGHTHGGQIRIPFLGAIHTQGTHLDRSRPAGWFTRGRARMFVSRGLGESIPLRFRSQPQVALIRIYGR